MHERLFVKFNFDRKSLRLKNTDNKTRTGGKSTTKLGKSIVET